MADEQIIVSVNYDTSEADKNIERTTDNIIKLEDANKSLRQDLKKTDEQLEKEGKSRADLNKELAKNQQQLQKNKAERRDNIKLIQSESKSIDELKAQNAALRKERNKLNTSTEEGRKRIAEINAQIDENTSVINENSSALEQSKNNVGNYTSSIIDAANETGALTGITAELGGIQQKLAGITTLLTASFKGATKGTGGLIRAQKLLKAALISTGIGAIVVALGSLVALLTQTQAGNDKLTEALNRFKAAIDATLGRLIKLGQAVGKLIKGETSFKEFREESKEAFSGLKEDIQSAILAADVITNLQIALRNANKEATTAIASLGKVAETQAAIADDATKSFQERQAAAEKAERAGIKAANIQLNLARQELQILKAQNAQRLDNGTITAEQQQQQADAAAKVIEAETALELTRIEASKRRSELAQDDFEQQLDFLLDVTDAQKTVNEQRIADDNKTLEERRKIFKETQKILNDSFNQQIELFESENDINLERDKLLKLNNQEIFEYARNLELSEIETNRLLEVIKERRFAIQDLANLQKDLTDEEIERREEANLKLQELRFEAQLKELEDIDAQRELLIQRENEDFERKLAQEGLLDEEIELLEFEHKNNLDAIDEEFNQNRINRQGEFVDITKQSLDSILNANQEFSDQRLSLAGETFTKLKEINASELEENEKNLSILSSGVQGFTNFVSANLDQQLSDLQMQKALELQLAGDNAEQREEVQRKFAKKEAEVRRKQFNVEKASAVAQVAIQTALGITKSIGQLGLPAATPFVIATGIAGALQAGIILAKKAPPVPSFADGGEVKTGVFGGASHAMGGTKGVFSDGTRVEVERGEGFFVMKRDATAQLAALSAINESYGGRSFGSRTRFAQEGGELDTQNGNASVSQQINQAISSLKVVVDIEDIKQGLIGNQESVTAGVISR